MTRTASDQSSSLKSRQTGSLAIPASISASVRLRNFFQSVLPRLGASRETTVVLFSFIASRSARRDQPANLVAEGTDDDRLVVVEKAEHHVARFLSAIRSDRKSTRLHS